MTNSAQNTGKNIGNSHSDLLSDTLSISHLKAGVSYQIDKLSGDPLILERLREVGFLPGFLVEFVRALPMGGAYIFRVGNMDIALRGEEAKCIQIKKLL